jgi:hypothetical protein
LLNEIDRLAKAGGYRTIVVEAHEDKPLGPLLAPYLRSLLFELDRVAGASDKVKRGLRVLRSFLGVLKITYGDVTIGLDVDPEQGSADSGDLEIDLPNLFVAIAEAAEERNSAVALLIDEIQYFGQKELGALIMAMHRVQQRQLPLVLLGAGLPILPPAWQASRSLMRSGYLAFRISERFPKTTARKRCKNRRKRRASRSRCGHCGRCFS